MRTNFLLIVLLFLYFDGLSQNLHKAVEVGDKLPAVPTLKVFNNTSNHFDLKDFEDALLILDFWHTGCSSCIEAMPKINMLQKKFGNKLKILPVTFEKLKAVKQFWENNRYTKDLHITTIVEDTILKNLFPHVGFPHEVWIYKGKVVSITSGLYLTEANIRRFMAGDTTQLPLKFDFYKFNINDRLFRLDSNQVDTRGAGLQYMAISEFKQGINSSGGSGGYGFIRDSVFKTIRVYGLNQSIFDCYSQLWDKIYSHKDLVRPVDFLTANQVIWAVSNRSKYTDTHTEANSWDWTLKNSICFESLSPDTGQTDKLVGRKAVSDLSRLLGLNVAWKKKLEDVYVIRKKRSYKKINVTQEAGISLISVIMAYNSSEKNLYLFNESGLDQIEIPIQSNPQNDITAIRDALSKVGLVLTKEKRAVDHLYFTEVDGGKIIDTDIQTAAIARLANSRAVNKPDKDVEKEFLRKLRQSPDVKSSKSGILYKVIRMGTEKNVSPTDSILINYEGTYVNGKVFSSSYAIGLPTLYVVSEVSQGGLSEVLMLLKEGSKVEIYVQPSLSKEIINTFPEPKPIDKPFILTVEIIRKFQ